MNILIAETLIALIGLARANNLWFHAAHHASKGDAFSGDHELLYSEVYAAYNEAVDGLVEWAIGLTNDETMSSPVRITELAIVAIRTYPEPCCSTALGIAGAALDVEKQFVSAIEETFAMLEGKRQLSLGLNDMLAALANKHETFVYKLQQRVRSTVGV